MENNFKNNLAYLVQSQNLDQNEFGLCFGVKKSVINQYISGRSFPKIDFIQKLASAYGFTIDSIINADIATNCKEKNIKPNLNLERLTIPEQVILTNFTNKNDNITVTITALNEAISSKNKLISRLEKENSELEEKLADFETSKKSDSDTKNVHQ